MPSARVIPPEVRRARSRSYPSNEQEPWDDSVTERELGVLAHHLRRPRRREHHLGFYGLDALEFSDELFDLFVDLRSNRAPGRRQRERHMDVAVRDRYAVDEPE